MSTDQTIYQHTQVGYVTGGVGAAGALIAYASFIAEQGRLGLLGGAMVGGLAAVAVLFSSLTVRIDAEALTFHFTMGFWKKRIPLHTIRRSTVVRNRIYHGWGIRWIARGWLYNVSGLDAVELALEDGGLVRIGTDEPEALMQALDEARQIA